VKILENFFNCLIDPFFSQVKKFKNKTLQIKDGTKKTSQLSDAFYSGLSNLGKLNNQ